MDDLDEKKRSLKLIEADAENGNPIGQFRLGLAFYYGEGADQDYEAAARWFTAAAEQGYVRARTALGVCYRRGEGVLPDYIEAVSLFRLAADQGDLSAIYNLGLCYFLGQGVSQDFEKAAGLFRRAAELGSVSEHYPFDSVPNETVSEPESSDDAVRLYREAVATIDALNARLREDSLNRDRAAFAADENQRKIGLLSREKAELEKVLREQEVESKHLTALIEQQAVDYKSQMCAVKDEADKQESRLRGEIAALDSKATSLSEHLEQAKGTIQSKESQVSRLQKDLGDQRDASLQKDRTIRKLQNELKNRDEKIQTQEQSIALQKSKIDRLNTQKPFVKKVNVLRWMDLFSIACLAVIGYELYKFGVWLPELYIWGLPLIVIVLNVLMLVCLAKRRFVIHTLLCVTELAAVAFIIVTWGCVFPAMVVAVPYGLITLWRICASPIKEIYFG